MNELNAQEINVIEQQAPEQQEKMLSQSEVNRLIGRTKAETEERLRRQLEEQYQREMEQKISQAQQNRNENVSREVDADSIYQQVAERLNADTQRKEEERIREAQRQHMQEIADSYTSKVEAAKTNYDDFDEVTGDFDATEFPQLVYLVAGLENAGDVIYELSKNPTKLATMNWLAKDAPRKAQSELRKLSASIQQNRQALTEAQNNQVAAPLDRVQPSLNTGSNGKLGIRDLRSQDWLRG